MRERLAAHRVQWRRRGLRPVQLWVPRRTFATEAHRQSALAAASGHAAQDQAFVGAIWWFTDEDDE